MVPLAEFLELEEDDREGLFPYIWAVDSKNRLMRVLVSAGTGDSTVETARLLAPTQVAGRCRQGRRRGCDRRPGQGRDGAETHAPACWPWSVGGDLSALARTGRRGAVARRWRRGVPTALGAAGGLRTGLDRHTRMHGLRRMHQINAPKSSRTTTRKRPSSSTPRVAVTRTSCKAAEKCTAGCIHPGTPLNPNEKDLERLIKRAEKFQ